MNSDNRIVLIDALRGFALLGIALIHSVEHFDFFHKPLVNVCFSERVDNILTNTVIFLISGKAYSIFALMFGFSFFIMMNGKEKNGIDFRWNFLWRLTILLCFGFINSLIYKGDILHIYALLGVLLIFLYNTRTNILIWVSVLLAIQIPTLYNLFVSFVYPEFEYVKNFGTGLWQEADKTYATGNFFEVVSFNLWKGRSAVWGWTYYNGRYLQLIALFIIGLILGRKRFFEETIKYKKNLPKTFIISSLTVIFFFVLSEYVIHLDYSNTQKMLLKTLIDSYSDIAFTTAIISSFILIYLRLKELIFFNLLATYGKISLTNYIMQIIIGVIFFYGFGFGMYRYMGATWSLIFVISIFSFQVLISKIWTQYFYYGPLEWLWRALTFLDFSIKFKKIREL